MTLLKNKAAGGYLLLLSLACGVVTTVLYAAFGVLSGTFTLSILALYLAAVVFGLAAAVRETAFSDVLSLVMTICLSAALALFIKNSVGDFAEMITPVGMYGNADNMGMRFVILGVTLVTILLSILEGFCKREK